MPAHAGGPTARVCLGAPTSPFYTQQLNDQAKGTWWLARINADDGEAPWTYWATSEIGPGGRTWPDRGTAQIWTKLLKVPCILKYVVVQVRRPRDDGDYARENLVLVHSSCKCGWLRDRIQAVWPRINPKTDFSVSKKALKWRDVQAICSIGEGLAYAKRDPHITVKQGFDGWWDDQIDPITGYEYDELDDDAPAGCISRLQHMHEKR